MSDNNSRITNELAKINNNMISYINKSSRDEFDRIVDFTLSLVIKEADEAEKYETIDTSKNAFEYIGACLETDTNDDDTRRYIIDNYKEKNYYYKELFQKYGIEYLRARQAKDGDILHYTESILDNKELSIYLEIYYSSKVYVDRVFRTEAFLEESPLYNNFMRFFIAFITIERFVSYRLENSSDIDYFNDYTLKNLLIEYRLEEFAQLSSSYQKRIAKKANDLIKNKGTDVVIVDILKLFGFDNIQVFKYYLLRDYPDIDNKGNKDWTKPYLKFIKVPIGDLNYEKTFNDYSAITFQSMTENDPYWIATEEECLTKDFNFIQTKYLSVETTMSFMKETMTMSYVINLLYHIQEKHPDENNLYVTNKKISSKPMRVVDVLVALNTLVIRRNGCVDRTCIDENSVRKVYDYKSGKTVDLDSSKNKVYAFNFETFTEPHNVTFTSNPSKKSSYYGKLYDWQYDAMRQNIHLDLKDLNEYTLVYMEEKNHLVYNSITQFKKLNTHLTNAIEVDKGHINDFNEKEIAGMIDISEFNTTYNINNKIKEDLTKDIMNVKTYEGYRHLKHIYDIKFTADMVKSIFNGYATYTDYLKDASPDLFRYVQDIIDVMSLEEGLVEKDFYREGILNLANILDAYLEEFDNLFLENNAIVSDYIKEYLYKLLNIFKAYTVDINQLSIIYVMDDPLMNTVRLFDEGIFKNQFKRRDILKLYEKYKQLNLFDLYDYLVFLDKNKQLNLFDLEDWFSLYDGEYLDITDDQFLADCVFIEDNDSFLFNNYPLLTHYDTFVGLFNEYTFTTSNYLTRETPNVREWTLWNWSAPTLTYYMNLNIKEYPLVSSYLPNKEYFKLIESSLLFRHYKEILYDKVLKYFKETHSKDQIKYMSELIEEFKEVLVYTNDDNELKFNMNSKIKLSDSIVITRLDSNGNLLIE